MDPVAGGSSSEFLLAEPEEQVQARIDERDNVFQAYPILQDMMQHLTERIAFYKSTDAIDTSVLADPEAFMHAVAGNKLAAASLQKEYDLLDTLIKEHVQPDIGGIQ